ncbi:MAG: hypothetical protein U5K75_01430 [Ahrensia sp.]|nr:hypothetical protein [Ahrensia sp.]
MTFAEEPDNWRSVRAGDLSVRIRVAGPTVLGRALGLVPDAISTAPWFCAITSAHRQGGPARSTHLQQVQATAEQYYGCATTSIASPRSRHHQQGEDLGSLTSVTPR